MKKCNKCSKSLPLSEFHTSPTTRDKLRPNCKECQKQYRAEWYQRNRERLIKYSQEYVIAHPEESKEKGRKWHERNRFKVREKAKVWREANREHLKRAKQADYQKNIDKYKQAARSREQKHPEYGRVSHHRRRAQRFGVQGDLTATAIIGKFSYFGWRCYLCQTPGTIYTLEIDHRTPMARGGTNWPANIAPACSGCNQKKRQRTEGEYRETLNTSS